MRLIDADALKTVHGMRDDCAECDKEERKKWVKCQYDRNFTKMDFCGWLDTAPTVDAVPVVRCKDCKWWHDWNGECYGNGNMGYGVGRKADDFCSWGKCKDD